jgi:hypothetical protein
MKTPLTNLLRRIGALGIGLALAGGALVACNDDGDGSTPPPVAQEGDFVLSLGAPEVTTLRGAPGRLLVKIERKNGFADEVVVDLVDPPAGVTSTAAVLNVGAQALLGITVADDVALGDLSLTVAATAAGKVSSASLKVTVQPGQPATGKLIATALAAGRIDLGTSLLYRAYAMVGDSRLPREFVGAGQTDEDNGLFREIARNAPAFSAELNEQLLAFTVRPTDPRSVFSARPAAARASAWSSGRERALASVPVTDKSQCTTGTEEWISRLSSAAAPGLRVWVLCHGDAPRNAAAQSDLDRVVKLLDRVLPEMTRVMKPMLGDKDSSVNSLNFDDAVDLYVLPTGVNTIPGWENVGGAAELFAKLQSFGGPAGNTQPVAVNKEAAYSATIFIPEREVRTENFQINLIHELFHAIQYAYNGNLGGFWFSDASAVWASTYFPRALGGLDMKPKYLGDELAYRFVQGRSADAAANKYGFLLQTLGLLDTSNGSAPYSSFIWPLFMEQMGGENGASRIAAAWVNLGRVAGDGIAPKDASTPATSINQASDAVNNALAFETNFRKFALRNLNREFLPGDPLPAGQRYKSQDPQFPFPTPLPANLKPKNPKTGDPDVSPINNTTDSAYTLVAPLAPLSAGYYVFNSLQAAPELRQVRFDLDGLQVDGLDVDALVKINGTWESAPRDLKGKTLLRFCLDKPEEKLEEIWFIFSNHLHQLGEEINPRFRVKGLQAPCASEIAGRSSSVLGARNATGVRFELDATGVVWELDPTFSDANVALYRPVRGSVAFRLIYPGCTFTLTPSSYDIKPDDYNGLNATGTLGSITVNFNNQPPTYGGGAATAWMANYTKECADGSSNSGQILAGGEWFASPPGDGQAKENGTLIEGAFSSGGDDYNFKFTLTR